nr:uncharacterized protein LOC110380417 [Helicoverpa armigera]
MATRRPTRLRTSATTVKVTEKSSKRTTSRRGQISKGNETFPPGVKYDINAIIAIIANLTYDYEWNLTEEFNRTLIEHGVPTCPTASTLSTTPTTPAAYDFSNTSIVGKCFVCGLRTPEIPRSAACADAFSGDFLPLAPIDARARGQIATFRKYCRHLDVHNYVENPSEPRSIYGRFTGGCGVRWTDLTGVYTQRTCRARFRPMMGLHFASKRMAKLELALINVENGCIVSPMASLLAMSRGVSLYARFHACVCSGNWCNRARRPLPLSTLPPALALLATRAWSLR